MCNVENTANTTDFKAALIYALNYNEADPLLDTIQRCCIGYETGGLAELENALFRLRIDIRSMISTWQRNLQDLREYRAESTAQAREEKAQRAFEERMLKGMFTDEAALPPPVGSFWR